MLYVILLWAVVTPGATADNLDRDPEVVLSNLKLPQDTSGRAIITGETDVLSPITPGGDYVVYTNDWGGCRDTDCCESPGGCASCCYVPPTPAYPDACVFTKNHSVVAYSTADFREWQYRGIVFSGAKGIEFRPHVVFNKARNSYVMWFEDRPAAIRSSGYSVATSDSPYGPFHTIKSNVAMADVPGDFDLLIDDDGTGWHVQTTTNDPNATKGFVVTRLNDDFTGPAVPRQAAVFKAPMPAEGPAFFKRGGAYYILGGTTCCACRGGSSIYVFRAPHPLGPWEYLSDIGRTKQPYDPHSPTNYVTRAQASTVFELGGEWLWMGNQWVTSGYRNSGLLYWTVLDFQPDGGLAQVEWKPNATINLKPGLHRAARGI